MRIAEAAQQLALVIDDADPRPEIRALQVDRHRRAELADIADRVAGVVHVEAARAVQIVPLRLVFAVAVEHLHPVVLAVGDIDPAIGIGADVVHDVELAGLGAGLAPRHQQLAVRRIFMDAGVAVAVRDIDLALRRQARCGCSGGNGSPLIYSAGLPGMPISSSTLPSERAFAHEMPAVIGQIDRIVRAPYGRRAPADIGPRPMIAGNCRRGRTP